MWNELTGQTVIQVLCSICGAKWVSGPRWREDALQHEASTHQAVALRRKETQARLRTLLLRPEDLAGTPARCAFCNVMPPDTTSHERLEHPNELRLAQSLLAELDALDGHCRPTAARRR